MSSRILQAILIIAVLFPLVRKKQLLQVFVGIEKGYKVFAGAMFVLVLVGHLAAVNTFPFVSWSMYGLPTEGDPFVYEYAGVLRSGKIVPLIASRLLPSIAADRLSSKLYRQIGAMNAATDSIMKAALFKQHQETLTALARLYSRKFPDDPMEVVIASRTTIPLHPREAVAETETKVLWRVKVQEAAK
jgi:hypothetical protein